MYKILWITDTNTALDKTIARNLKQDNRIIPPIKHNPAENLYYNQQFERNKTISRKLDQQLNKVLKKQKYPLYIIVDSNKFKIWIIILKNNIAHSFHYIKSHK